MRTIYVAVAGLLSVATAQSLCAVNCFQSVVTEHPPLTCKEDNMYLCFCKSKDLQNFFTDCAYSKCGSGANEAINFGVGLCKDLGVPISIPPRPSPSAVSQVPSSPAATSATSAPSSTSFTTLPSAGQSTLSTATVSSVGGSVETHGPTSAGTTASTFAPSAAPHPSSSKNQTGTQPTPSSVVVNKGVSMNAAPGILAAAGIGAALLHLL